MELPNLASALTLSLRSLGIAGGRVLVGVSGGADSVALLVALARIRDVWPDDPRLTVIAAHLDHQLRGPESTADAAWVRQLCDALRVPLVAQLTDVRRTAAERGIGIEEAARNARYAFLRQAAIEQHSPWVLVAHTADDQVETVLHHVLRGTGIDGLRGMPSKRPLADGVTLARPLLNTGRACIEHFLRSLGQDWREDATNRDLSLTRNTIRHDLLPGLRDRFNPHIEAAILHLAQQAADVQEVIDRVATELLTDCCLDAAASAIRLDAAKLENVPIHLVREVLRRAWREQQWPQAGMGFDHWTTAARVALGQSAAVDLPGRVHAERRGSLLVLTRKTAAGRVESGTPPG